MSATDQRHASAGRVSAGGFGPPPRSKGERGQATVEFALCLPVIFAVLLGLVQAGVVVRDQIRLTHAAREAVREAAVDDRREAPRQAALARSGLDAARLKVEVRGQHKGSRKVQAELTYSVPTEVPLVGFLVPDVELRARSAMRREGD